jgi:hypothetical protein
MAYSSATTKEIRIFKATIAKVGKVRIDIKTEVDSRTNFIFAGREGGIGEADRIETDKLFDRSGSPSEWQPSEKEALAVLREKHVRAASDAIISARQVILACDAMDKTLSSEKAA